MLKKHRALILATLCAFGVIATHFTGYNFAYIEGKDITGKIIKVADGDTLTLLHNGENLKIRFYGIDAPESKQSFGRQSKAHLLKLCPLNSQARIKIKETDKYNRIVGIVFCNNRDVNAEQVKEGYAWAYKEYSLAYVHLELKARVESKGLWSEKNPLKPSIYRKQQAQYKEWANAHIPRDEIK